MEAQLQRPSHPHQDVGLHSEEQQHEGHKKSVLKKVKEKAKKIKNTIKRHGHAHRHENEEEEEDPEVHGAPIYESTVVRSKNLASGSNSDEHATPPTLPIQEDNTPPNISSSNYAPRSHTFENSNDEIDNPVGEPAAKGQDTKNESQDTIGGKISSALAPVYEKVAEAGSAVVAKVQGGEGGDNGMMEYVSEKLRPGEEDKELSEAITDAIHKKKEAVWGPEEEEQHGGKGRVTVSKEVAERLGTAPENKREGEDALGAGEESSGQGVADRLKDAVGAWLAKSTGIQTAQDSIGNAYVNNAGSGSGGVRRTWMNLR